MTDPAETAKAIVEQLPEEVNVDDPDMMDRVVDLYFLSEGKRTTADTEAFGVVLERLLYSAEAEKRADVANRLAFSQDAPVRLMRRLAFDSIMVARPVLQYSNRLSESDLVTLARKLEQDHLNAIAHRRRLTTTVTDVLVDRGNSNVLVTVTLNASASFTDEAMERLSKKADKDPELQSALGLRPEPNTSLFDRFRSYLSGRLLIAVEDEDPVRPKPPAKEGQSALAADEAEPPEPEPETPEPARDEKPAEDGSAPIQDPIRPSYASEKNLVKLAKDDMLEETVTCMAKLTGLDSEMIEHCLLKAELSALMVLCKAHGFTNTTFTTLLKLRQKQSKDPMAIDVKTMLYRYEAMQTHTAKRIIQYANKKRG